MSHLRVQEDRNFEPDYINNRNNIEREKKRKKADKLRKKLLKKQQKYNETESEAGLENQTDEYQ